MKLIDYIAIKFDGNQSQFASYQEVKPQQVTQWIKKGFLVIDDTLFSPRRELKTKGNDNDNEKLFTFDLRRK